MFITWRNVVDDLSLSFLCENPLLSLCEKHLFFLKEPYVFILDLTVCSSLHNSAGRRKFSGDMLLSFWELCFFTSCSKIDRDWGLLFVSNERKGRTLGSLFFCTPCGPRL